jgi:hypothetical protein
MPHRLMSPVGKGVWLRCTSHAKKLLPYLTIQSAFGNWWSIPKVAVHLVLAVFVLWLPTRKMLSVARIVVIGYAAIALNNLYLAGWLI